MFGGVGGCRVKGWSNSGGPVVKGCSCGVMVSGGGGVSWWW